MEEKKTRKTRLIMYTLRRKLELKMNQKEVTKIKNAVTAVKTAFCGLISRLHTAKEAVSLNIGQQTCPKLKCREEKEWKKQRIQELWDTFNMHNMHINVLSEEREKEAEEILEVIMAMNFPK